jgi:signal transduction histidine kinase
MQGSASASVLIVDDQPQNLYALEALLEPLDLETTRAYSGREALKLLLQKEFALILMDVSMPEIDGFETAELIRSHERFHAIPIIFLTAIDTGKQAIARGYELGAVDYLTKPIDVSALRAKVSVFVELHQKNQALLQAQQALEQRVLERTAQLEEEIAERRRIERALHEQAAERLELYQATEVARAAAEQALKLRDQFLALAAHELKTPMTAILGSAQLIQRQVERQQDASSRERNRVRSMLDQIQRLNRLIASLLDLTRLQEGRLSIELRPLDLCKVGRQIVEELQPTLHQHELAFICSEQQCWINGDQLRLEQVFQNLLQNAIKYSPEGGSISLELQLRDGYASISISDQGIGIPGEDLPHIFDRFHRGRNVDVSQLSGMGIGLYVVKEIVELHGGTIDAQSVEGQGSRFQLMLPRVDSP